METPWESRYAQRTQRMGSSAIRELLKLTEQPDIISFGGGMPAPDVFPVDDFAAACATVLRTNGAQALQYGATEGYLPLREMIARHTARYGINITPDNIMITSGSQQALDLLGKVFINRGDRILVENPTYLGALQAWNAYGAEYVTVRMDENGMVTDELEEALRTGPKFIYVLSNFQNPTGVTLSLERRVKLIEMADRYGIPIIEDDPYGQLRYEGEHLPSVVSLDDQFRENGTNPYRGNVIYLSTFSKTLAPGIRLAWVVAPQEVIRKLVQAKQGADLHTATFSQMVAHEVAKGGFLDRHVWMIRRVYLQRRDVMLDAMDEFFPKGVTWTRPKGGLFLWATMPPELKAAEVLKTAIEQKVAFVPGMSFYARGGGESSMRLNFSNANPEKILVGIERLGKVILQKMQEKNLV
ncbi:MAG: PLP-dependent aminotransferase family protein [Anaerolineales bacterium]|nr:PLP-dependent aminotransferase family protein [Anaerolineales bacterium]